MPGEEYMVALGHIHDHGEERHQRRRGGGSPNLEGGGRGEDGGKAGGGGIWSGIKQRIFQTKSRNNGARRSHRRKLSSDIQSLSYSCLGQTRHSREEDDDLEDGDGGWMIDRDSDQRRLSKNLSLSHESVFQAEPHLIQDASVGLPFVPGSRTLSSSHLHAGHPDGGGPQHHHQATSRPHLATSNNALQTELMAVLRKRQNLGSRLSLDVDTDVDEEEDLGLPKSLQNSPGDFSEEGRPPGGMWGSSRHHSSCSDNSLLSLDSFDNKLDHREAHHSHPTSYARDPPRSLHPQASPGNWSDGDQAAGQPLHKLNHNAAKHKMAVRPKRNHGIGRRPKQQVMQQVTEEDDIGEEAQEERVKVGQSHISLASSNSVENLAGGGGAEQKPLKSMRSNSKSMDAICHIGGEMSPKNEYSPPSTQQASYFSRDSSGRKSKLKNDSSDSISFLSRLFGSKRQKSKVGQKPNASSEHKPAKASVSSSPPDARPMESVPAPHTTIAYFEASSYSSRSIEGRPLTSSTQSTSALMPTRSADKNMRQFSQRYLSTEGLDSSKPRTHRPPSKHSKPPPPPPPAGSPPPRARHSSVDRSLVKKSQSFRQINPTTGSQRKQNTAPREADPGKPSCDPQPADYPSLQAGVGQVNPNSHDIFLVKNQNMLGYENYGDSSLHRKFHASVEKWSYANEGLKRSIGSLSHESTLSNSIPPSHSNESLKTITSLLEEPDILVQTRVSSQSLSRPVSNDRDLSTVLFNPNLNDPVKELSVNAHAADVGSLSVSKNGEADNSMSEKNVPTGRRKDDVSTEKSYHTKQMPREFSYLKKNQTEDHEKVDLRKKLTREAVQKEAVKKQSVTSLVDPPGSQDTSEQVKRESIDQSESSLKEEAQSAQKDTIPDSDNKIEEAKKDSEIPSYDGHGDTFQYDIAKEDLPSEFDQNMMVILEDDKKENETETEIGDNISLKTEVSLVSEDEALLDSPGKVSDAPKSDEKVQDMIQDIDEKSTLNVHKESHNKFLEMDEDSSEKQPKEANKTHDFLVHKAKYIPESSKSYKIKESLPSTKILSDENIEAKIETSNTVQVDDDKGKDNNARDSKISDKITDKDTHVMPPNHPFKKQPMKPTPAPRHFFLKPTVDEESKDRSSSNAKERISEMKNFWDQKHEKGTPSLEVQGGDKNSGTSAKRLNRFVSDQGIGSKAGAALQPEATGPKENELNDNEAGDESSLPVKERAKSFSGLPNLNLGPKPYRPTSIVHEINLTKPVNIPPKPKLPASALIKPVPAPRQFKSISNSRLELGTGARNPNVRHIPGSKSASDIQPLSLGKSLLCEKEERELENAASNSGQDNHKVEDKTSNCKEHCVEEKRPPIEENAPQIPSNQTNVGDDNLDDIHVKRLVNNFQKFSEQESENKSLIVRRRSSGRQDQPVCKESLSKSTSEKLDPQLSVNNQAGPNNGKPKLATGIGKKDDVREKPQGAHTVIEKDLSEPPNPVAIGHKSPQQLGDKQHGREVCEESSLNPPPSASSRSPEKPARRRRDKSMDREVDGGESAGDATNVMSIVSRLNAMAM